MDFPSTRKSSPIRFGHFQLFTSNYFSCIRARVTERIHTKQIGREEFDDNMNANNLKNDSTINKFTYELPCLFHFSNVNNFVNQVTN